jgi:hypothetical protein
MPAQAVIQVRRDTATNWETTNPVLAVGEIGFDTTNNQLKIGTGTNTWNQLQFASGDFKISETQPSPARNGDLWVTTEKIAAGASIDRINGKRVIVSQTTPSTPAGNWNVGDVWISY